MGETWVLNASPIITLAKVSALHLLERPDHRLIIPTEVAEEVLDGPPGDPARATLAAGWGERVDPVAVPPAVLEWGLGRGESAVLAWAWRERGTALLDDGEARRCARALGIPVFGTLGLVVRARREGRLPSAADTLRAMRQAGFRLRDDVVARVLRETVAEEWRP